MILDLDLVFDLARILARKRNDVRSSFNQKVYPCEPRAKTTLSVSSPIELSAIYPIFKASSSNRNNSSGGAPPKISKSQALVITVLIGAWPSGSCNTVLVRPL